MDNPGDTLKAIELRVKMSTVYCKGICNSDKDCYGLCDSTLDPTEDAAVIVLYRKLAKFESSSSIFYEGLYWLNIENSY